MTLTPPNEPANTLRMITLRCPYCKDTMQVESDENDPPGTAVVENGCPKCSDTEFDDIHYFDAEGKEIKLA